MFARIEKRVRKKEEITSPQEYVDIFEEHGTVIQLGGIDCPVSAWKTTGNEMQLKTGNWHLSYNAIEK